MSMNVFTTLDHQHEKNIDRTLKIDICICIFFICSPSMKTNYCFP